jgi:hypothetical protein
MRTDKDKRWFTDSLIQSERCRPASRISQFSGDMRANSFGKTNLPVTPLERRIWRY